MSSSKTIAYGDGVMYYQSKSNAPYRQGVDIGFICGVTVGFIAGAVFVAFSVGVL